MNDDDMKRERKLRLDLARHTGRDLRNYIASQDDVRFLLRRLDEARAAERAAGAREMRERAAALCHEVSIAWSERGEHEIADALDDAGNGISDIPLEPVTP